MNNLLQMVNLSGRRHLGFLVSTKNIARNGFYGSLRYFQRYHTFPCDVQIPRYALAPKSNMAAIRHLGLGDPANFISDFETWGHDISSCKKWRLWYRNEQFQTKEDYYKDIHIVRGVLQCQIFKIHIIAYFQMDEICLCINMYIEIHL